MSELLQQAWSRGTLRAVDYYLGRQLQRMVPGASPLAILLAALASRAVGQGDVCIDLAQLAEGPLPTPGIEAAQAALPSLPQLLDALRQWPAVAAPGAAAPLILDGTRLYLGRYWHYEQAVALALRQRAQPVAAEALDLAQLQTSLQALFPPAGSVDWQCIAAATAVLQGLCVVSGGPGTGKTHTVASILALLLQQTDSNCRMALVAPTGKAAARLTEALRKARAGLACSDEIKARMPDSSATIHRLLGLRPGAAQPRFHRDNPLDLDLLVVDEASMVDLPTMARLLDAVPPACRIVLLGDKDQLASVEAGSVFADISSTRKAGSNATLLARLQQVCDWSLPAPAALQKAAAVSVEHSGAAHAAASTAEVGDVGDCVVLLQRSYRFNDEAGIGALARAINAGEAELALALLQQGADGLRWQRIDSSRRLAALQALLAAHLDALQACDSPQAALACLERYRILCAVRKGPFGVEQINQDVERLLRQRSHMSGRAELYRGRPLMITHNAPALGLFNGDVGILWPAADGSLKAWFQTAQSGLKAIGPARLPAHETAWAMTVHKSQGSEFAQVLLLLPQEANPVLTRELLYTGVTRARETVELWAEPDIVTQCINSRVQRVSGLADKLLVPD